MKKNKKFFKSRKNNNINYGSNTLSMDNEYMKRKDKITSFFLNSKYIPMTRKEIAGIIGVPKEDKDSFISILNELKESGIIFLDSNARYNVVSDNNSHICVFEKKTDTYGFACPQDKKIEDFYIPQENFLNALDSDTILVVRDNNKKYNKQHKKVGRIVKILKRAITSVIGEVYSVKKKTFIKPIDDKLPSVLINKVLCENFIQNGMMVQVDITNYPNKKRNFEGNIVKVICNSKDEQLAYVKALYHSYDLNEKENFDKEIIREIDEIKNEVNTEELKYREDRTYENVYTIDSEDAKDLDDAICVKKLENENYLLSVHIADVSHYVKDGTKLDEEAIKRATSIYVPGSVIPMLPKKLSNGICSLNENELRLTLSVDMEITKNGNVINSKIYKGYIKSKKKMTYEKVYKCINKSDKKVLQEYNDYLEDINLMLELASILRNKRHLLGSIDFDIPETKIELNEEGIVTDIHPYDKNIANNIIEEFMLITNMTIAETFYNYSAPFIYRIHEKPDEEKLKTLNEVLSMYNKRIKSIKGVTSRDIQQLLSNFKTEEEKNVISTFALRALKLARYDSECLGHFGLAFKYYCHFTSPIRRYPDLFIHRVISDYLKNGYVLSEKLQEKYKSQAISYSIISSEMEKEAAKIERDFDDMYMSIFMKDKVSEEFTGIVSSVTSFGIFVMLPSTVEGLVHISSMKGYYVFDEKKCILQNKNGKSYKIGDKVKVRVEKVDVRLKQIDFTLV